MNHEYRGLETGKLLGLGSVGGSRRATPLQVQGRTWKNQEAAAFQFVGGLLGLWSLEANFEVRTSLKNGNINEVGTLVTRYSFE